MDDVCDVCGKPATSLATDFQEWPNHETGHYECAPIGPKKRGCDEHPVKSVKHEVSQRPDGVE